MSHNCRESVLERGPATRHIGRHALRPAPHHHLWLDHSGKSVEPATGMITAPLSRSSDSHHILENSSQMNQRVSSPNSESTIQTLHSLDPRLACPTFLPLRRRLLAILQHTHFDPGPAGMLRLPRRSGVAHAHRVDSIYGNVVREYQISDD